jgi:hypothetical protein
MRLARSVVGVIVGYAVFAASAFLFFQLAGRDPHAPQDLLFATEATVFGMAMAALGGLLAGWIAGRRPVLHAGFVALLLVLGAGASLISSPGEHAKWSQVSALLLMAPSAVVGGLIKAKYFSRGDGQD